MEAEAGMSIKERLAMLQANNTNPQLSGPMKSPTHLPQKTTPTLTPNNTTTNNNSTTTSPVNNKTSDRGDKPNGPVTALKPVVKPAATSALAAGKAKEKDGTPQLAFKLRPTGPHLAGGGTGVIPPAAKPEPSSATNVSKVVVGTPAMAGKKPWDSHGGMTPLVPKKPGIGAAAGGGGAGSSGDTAGTNATSVALRDNSNASNAPRPPSIQERMAALRDKAGDGGAGGSSSGSGGGPKSPDPVQKKAPLFPPKAGGFAVKPSDLVKSLHEAAQRRKASEAFIRNSDGKRFHKVDVASVNRSSFPAPPKPPALDNVDLVSFLQAYAAARENKLKTDAAQGNTVDSAAGGGEGEGEMDELYVQAESEIVQLRVSGRDSVKRATSVRVSEIPELTEEEEEHELYTDGVSGQATIDNIAEVSEEVYDDCSSAAASVVQNQQQQEFEEQEEIYEPLDDEMDAMPEPEPVASPGLADDKKGKKEKAEKEKVKDKKKDKTKDDTSKKEEKERKKKEEEIKKQRAKFGLKEGDEKVGEGVVKNNATGGVFTKDLAVNKGEIVTVMRMDNNPSGKWLVQNDQGKLGFVNSNNIEVATPAIRQMMTAVTGDSLPGDEEPEELYEALPEEEMDEIYEEL